MTGSMHRRARPSPDTHRTVRFTQRDVDDAARLLTMIASGTSDAPSLTPGELEESSDEQEPDRLRRFARQIYEKRQKRIALFGPQMFGEPAWEMLLILYLEEGGQRQLQSRLVDLSGASRSTGARWIDHIVRKGLARREDHPTDKRRNFVTLTESGRNLLEMYLSETCE